jgi:hypothetical protein
MQMAEGERKEKVTESWKAERERNRLFLPFSVDRESLLKGKDQYN